MSDRLSKTMGVVLGAVCLLVGCEKIYKRSEKSATLKAVPEAISVSTDFAADAIEATGGLDTWTGVKQLRFDCIVTFYKPDDSFYLTQQRYDVYPRLNAMDISGREPKGDYVWRFSNGRLNNVKRREQVDELPIELERQCFARLILAITTAPVRLSERSAQFIRQDRAIRIQGQWYESIERVDEQASQAMFYQNRDTHLVDMIRISCEDKFLTVRGYDYQKIDEDGPLAPTKIEIFRTGAGGDLQKRLVQIDCHVSEQM